jgi:hypothetical protein
MRRHQRIKAHADQLRAAAKESLRRSVEIGRSYVVEGYWTGTFKARVESVSADCDPIVRLVVLDAMRRRAALSCDFPECLAELGHDGDHTFDPDFRAGIVIELAFRNARFLPTVFEEFQPRQQTTPANEDKTA